MSERQLIYFASDVHLGPSLEDSAEREGRFVSWLRSIPADRTRAVFLLGDVWDFWYEYRDVVPRGYVRVFAALTDLMDAGVEVYFCPGNHDIWCYSYFAQMGIRVIHQPYVFEAGGKVLCVGHGDGLGPGLGRYRAMNALFKSRAAQWLFSLLHPWLAFRLGEGWSSSNRRGRVGPYVWKGSSEPLYKWAQEVGSGTHVDFFIFGHLHCETQETLPCGARLLMLGSWLSGSPYILFDGSAAEHHPL